MDTFDKGLQENYRLGQRHLHIYFLIINNLINTWSVSLFYFSHSSGLQRFSSFFWKFYGFQLFNLGYNPFQVNFYVWYEVKVEALPPTPT